MVDRDYCGSFAGTFDQSSIKSSARAPNYLGLSFHRCSQGRSGDAVTRSDEASTRVALPSLCSL